MDEDLFCTDKYDGHVGENEKLAMNEERMK